MKKIFYFSLISILIFTIFSCSPALSISLKNDDSADIQLEISNTESFFSNFSAFMDFSEDNFYDKEILSLNLEELGFSNINLETKKNADLKLFAQLKNLSNLEQENPLSSLFIKNENSFEISINPDNLIDILETLPEITDYLDLLMAPVYTGEELSEQEYLELFASVYGESFAKDFENTTFMLQVNVLDKIKNIETAKDNIASVNFEENVANIKIPLYKLLCNQDLTFFKIHF
ncbi:MAG: hypothetical protein UH788_11625 [Treponemataceae bacterium]|nr:hypothetical protein [Treponemataceae bacterium]